MKKDSNPFAWNEAIQQMTADGMLVGGGGGAPPHLDGGTAVNGKQPVFRINGEDSMPHLHPQVAIRGILFRGKREDTGEWVYGDIWQNKNIFICPTGTGELMRIDPASLGQFCGQYAKNSVRGFEGDIVRRNDSVGVIKFADCGFYIDWVRGDEDDSIWELLPKCEIIGNMTDNPERAWLA